VGSDFPRRKSVFHIPCFRTNIRRLGCEASVLCHVLNMCGMGFPTRIGRGIATNSAPRDLLVGCQQMAEGLLPALINTLWEFQRTVRFRVSFGAPMRGRR